MEDLNIESPTEFDNGDQLWTVKEVSAFFQLKPDTVRAMARRGDIPAFKVGRIWRFSKTELLKMTKQKPGSESNQKGSSSI